MAEFLQLTIEQRARAFEQAATQRAVHPVIVEKDFWVCWMLRALFSSGEIAPHIVFKGGTSLSKVYSVINRFSEDIDVSVSPAFVGVDVKGLAKLRSRAQHDMAMVEMQRLCRANAETVIAPVVEAAAVKDLGQNTGGAWLTVDMEGGTSNLLFHYPTTQARGLDYIPRTVKLELGSLTDQEPTRQAAVVPLVAQDFPQLFPAWRCDVTALEVSRSFWEKATILHSEYFRAPDQPTPIRYARHYSDVVQLAQHGEAPIFMRDTQQCARVVDWKGRFYARAWARYDLARRGTFRLMPAEHRIEALEKDYTTMQPMFMQEPEPFETVLEQLAAAEREINRD